MQMHELQQPLHDQPHITHRSSGCLAAMPLMAHFSNALGRNRTLALECEFCGSLQMTLANEPFACSHFAHVCGKCASTRHENSRFAKSLRLRGCCTETAVRLDRRESLIVLWKSIYISIKPTTPPHPGHICLSVYNARVIYILAFMRCSHCKSASHENARERSLVCNI